MIPKIAYIDCHPLRFYRHLSINCLTNPRDLGMLNEADYWVHLLYVVGFVAGFLDVLMDLFKKLENLMNLKNFG